MRRKTRKTEQNPLVVIETELGNLEIVGTMLSRLDPHADPEAMGYLGDRVSEHTERMRAAIPGLYRLLPTPMPEAPVETMSPEEARRIREGIAALLSQS